MDSSNIVAKYKLLEKNLKNFKIFYAVKCNPSPSIIEKLNKLGASFEIASLGELNKLLKLGINSKKIIFSNPVKPVEHIQEAFKLGVMDFAFDSIEELDKITSVAPKAKVHLRLAITNEGSLVNLSNKFGADLKDALILCEKAIHLGLELEGLTFHVGSQAEDVNVWVAALNDVRKVLTELEGFRIRINTLNIGGGFPVNYGRIVPSIASISKVINKNIKLLPYKLNLWCEPGRYLVGEAGVIASTIIGSTKRNNLRWLYLDTGRFQSFVELFESDELNYPIFTSLDATNNSSKSLQEYTVTGPTCDSFDTIFNSVKLPSGLKVGDKLYFATTGAYTTVYGSAFNDFPVPKTIVV